MAAIYTAWNPPNRAEDVKKHTSEPLCILIPPYPHWTWTHDPAVKTNKNYNSSPDSLFCERVLIYRCSDSSLSCLARLHLSIHFVAVCARLRLFISAYHVGLPGLLYIVRSNDDRDFPRLHNLHQMLPDPRIKDGKKTKKNTTHYITPDLCTNGVFLNSRLTCFTSSRPASSRLIRPGSVITQQRCSNTLQGWITKKKKHARLSQE